MLGRNLTNKINWFMDEMIPPLFRECRLLMYPLFRMVFGKNSKHFLEFKSQAPLLNAKDLRKLQLQLSEGDIPRATNLNSACIRKILGSVAGNSVLDVGCGTGFLLSKITAQTTQWAVGTDIALHGSELAPFLSSKNRAFAQSSVTALPFRNKAFDTVVATHVIEHILDIHEAVSELRRVGRKRLILVVPRQREYKYTFDSHLWFFPNIHALKKILRNPAGTFELLDNDIFYQEPLD